MNVKINSMSFPLLSATAATEFMKNYNRDVVTLKMEATFDDAATSFVDGATFTILDDADQPYEYKDHTMAGQITDHRDGTITVKMGKANTAEQDALDAQQAAEAQAAKVSEDLVTLAGKSVSSDTDISALRLTFEAAADKLSDNDAKIARSLTKAWTTNEAVVTGDRRYFAPNDSLYKSLQDHITSVNTFPDTATDYWVLL